MIAALPMYDLPWLRQTNDRLWTDLAAKLRAQGFREVPATLDRGLPLGEGWLSPDLLLGQTCGYPLVTQLRDKVRVVATPHYVAEGCNGPFHRAAILVRRDDPARVLDDLRGRKAGVNGRDSNSGMNLFRAAIAEVAGGSGFFASVTPTGSHARSVVALLSDRIDAASIDAVTLALLRDRYPQHADRLRVLHWTAASPALPLITSIHSSDALVAALRTALEELFRDRQPDHPLYALRIGGFSTLRLEDYRPVLGLEKQAVDRGYAALR